MIQPRIRTLAVAGALVASAAAAPSAHGHAVVQPGAGRPADPQVYTVTVPSELESATVDVRLRMPEGIDFALAETAPPGWTAEIVRKGDAISEIRWTGGEIPPEQFGTFRFLIRNPVMEGEIRWPIVQRYADGEVQRWIGPEGSDEPASVTTISESAAPQNTVAVNGEQDAEPAATGEPSTGGEAASPAPAVTRAAEPGRDGLTLGLAGGALAVALVALAASLRRKESR